MLSQPCPVIVTQPAPAVKIFIQIPSSNVLVCSLTHTQMTQTCVICVTYKYGHICMSILSPLAESSTTTVNVVSNHFRETTRTSSK